MNVTLLRSAKRSSFWFPVGLLDYNNGGHVDLSGLRDVSAAYLGP